MEHTQAKKIRQSTYIFKNTQQIMIEEIEVGKLQNTIPIFSTQYNNYKIYIFYIYLNEP